MIEAKELRIGNWVLLGKKPQCVYQILYDRRNGHSINHVDYKEEFFKPIPLTSEILEKCGFKLNDNVGGNSELKKRTYWTNRITISQSGNEFNLWIDIDDDSWYSIEWIKIESLHQLQNLYYALTNEELNINL